MANHPSAEKRHRQNLKKRTRNRNAKSTIRTAIKQASAMAAEGNFEGARAVAVKATSLLGRAASKGILNKKTAHRTISRLDNRINSAESRTNA
jgi:small subunit ribosomal protein S20